MRERSIAVIGTGYVGLTTGASMAALGHRVVCADADAGKIERLRRAEVDILEPDLPELVRDGIAAGRLSFVRDTTAAVEGAEVVFLCLPTPMGAGGAADLAAVEAVAGDIRAALPPGCVVVNKSTVPVGTSERVAALLDRSDVAVVSNPEFLREGRAVHDFLHPDRIVVGSADDDAARLVADLYADLDAPVVLTDAGSAELAKYAANCFLAMKLSYANSLATLCETFGADIRDVTEAIGHDPRIGASYLQPGPGWGGSCLPKDTHALLTVCEQAGVDFPLLRATIDTNEAHQDRLVARIADAHRTTEATGTTGTTEAAEANESAGKTDATDATGSAGDGDSLRGVRLALLGLAFKAGTSDLRDSPALAVARRLRDRGAELVAYDPALTGQHPAALDDLVTVVDTPEEALKGAGACVVLTEWPQFRELDWESLADLLEVPTVYDYRNVLEPERLARAGLSWQGIGRPLAVAG
ncbi:UDP-glucose dehydrogenase family protein [Allostreptomyces psammosilenae]|uniref:UDP-glucose 6-dehydrogenase n=1 Tax=Allostreptomyces psammosilenae TaxID=1892865 RepID=A0A852ZX50_9ACTN|nr:UDP-glucose/GDP-mannose dehydrogenase family protein [Allostreptomyces psammosilenae]NYI05304.1 UDPglucose 6-dehydrogenase [Allostreptomyces psammosilenae]